MSSSAPTSPASTDDRLDVPVAFRELTRVEDLRLVQDMERRVWGLDDIDVSPVLLLVALVKSGALLLGAFVDDALRGFAFSVPGDRGGHRMHWSHMTGVDDTLRCTGLGTRLKLEQARRVAARGYSRIQWTYDPLQSLNAHVNLVKLGARASEYAEHVYGDSASDLHRGAPTDRLIATWDLDADGRPIRSPLLTDVAQAHGEPAGTVESRGEWQAYAPVPVLPDAPIVRLPVPARFAAMLQEAPDLATEWRLQTRAQFQDLFARGYEAVSFRRDGDRGEYLLVKS
jgi:predicted GNAT superfamily acetyltransferase